ncbi:MAG TPA: tetratricopeptide repeat protein [Spirochaetia bacterium]|nr:tetratricopeptide repeat protein [Spirochaetia bacterium]
MRYRRGPKAAAAALAAAVLGAVLVLTACVSTPPPPDTGTALTMQGRSGESAAAKTAVETLLARGTPDALSRARELAESSRALSPSDVLLYRWFAVELGRMAYPERLGTVPVAPEPPSGHPWARAFADARTGRIGTPREGADPLELLALASALFRGDSKETTRAATLALELFAQTRLESPLADHLQGVISERSANLSSAQERYVAAFVAAPDCYPALFGAARTLIALGRPQEAVDILSASKTAFGDSFGWVRLMALALYDSGRYDEAGPFVMRVLLEDPLDSRILLVRADMLVRAGDYRQAAPLLDAYAAVDPADRRYLFLRGRVAWEGSRNKDEALRFFRRLLSIYPDDSETLLAAARILALGTSSERGEAYLMAGRVLAKYPADPGALRILLAEEIRRRDWTSALATQERLRAADPEYRDRASLYLVYRSAGRFEEAFRVASEWRTASPDSEDARIAYIRSLIDRRDSGGARDLIARALTEKGSARFRSSLYFLQSLVQPNDEAALNSLRSSLVENVQNLEALTAMYDIYMRQKDAQKARFYLRQALAVAPDDPALARRREELIRLGLAP